MNIYTYTTSGGKDLIMNYIYKLPTKEQGKALDIVRKLERDGLEALEFLNTRQLKKNLWEIKFYRHNRFMYVIADENSFYILHACKKQKNKAEAFELETALNRAIEVGKELGIEFV